MIIRYIFPLFLLLSLNFKAQNIVVDDTLTAQELVQNVLFNNSLCASISNFNVIGGNFGTGENSYGYFNGNGSSFPFTEGVVLSTGTINNTVGPNTFLSDDDGINWQTDADLEAIFSNTLNATVLEFDFIPQTTFFSFDYIFASEEYQENNISTCQYSDVFAFLIKPAGGKYTNIAVIPNTNIPVSVTSVHPEIPNGCPAENEQYFGSWNDNTAPINFNGQTSVLTAQSVVIPNQTYHIKLVIADHTNYRYDSAVFILANSFNFGINLGQNRLMTTENVLCNTETLLLDAGIGNSFRWYKNNNLLVGETGQYLNITSFLGSGTYKVEKDNGFGCISEGEIIIEYDNSPILNNAELTMCVDDQLQISIFNLEDSYYDIINGDTSLIFEEFTYNGNVIENPQNYTNTEQNQTIIAKLVKPSGCFAYTNITLKVYQNPQIKPDETIYYCTDSFPETIQLESGLLNEDTKNYSFLWSSNEITNFININSIGNYTVTITNNENGCEVLRTITVMPSSVANIESVLITENEFYSRVSATINVVGTGDYLYAIDINPLQQDDITLYQEENIFINLLYGSHTLYVKDKRGCKTLIYQFVILQYPKFLTPNNDGRYDTWNINNINTLVQFNVVSDIFIYDRFGRVIAKIDPKGLGWDGTYNGKKAKPDDYWFTVKMIDPYGKIIIKKGHFSLI